MDGEADEVDLRSCLVENNETAPKDAQVEFEQWGGYQKRGSPEYLVMMQLKPKKIVIRAPGPGAIRMVDWEPFAKERLQDRNVILLTDGARTFSAQSARNVP